MSQVRPEGANGQAPPIDASLPFYPVRKVEARVNRSHQVRGLCIENPALKAGTKCNLIDKNLVSVKYRNMAQNSNAVMVLLHILRQMHGTF